MALLPYLDSDRLEAGCDEAGRGCLAGPVYAAAVIWPRELNHPLINDSKQLTEAQREEARQIVEERAVAWAVAYLEPAEIDELNILRASFTAMHRAIAQLAVRPEQLLIDGNRFLPYGELPYQCIVKGDGKYASIAAAGILAKTYRDAHMRRLHQHTPHYGWDRNKGYPTVGHRQAIAQHGASVHHRRSFRLLPETEQGRLFD